MCVCVCVSMSGCPYLRVLQFNINKNLLVYTVMAIASNLCQNYLLFKSKIKIKSCSSNIPNNNKTREDQNRSQIHLQKKCLRCNTLYSDAANSPTACSFHGHTTGTRFFFN